MTSASSGWSVSVYPRCSSEEPTRCESATFIWQPSVQMWYFIVGRLYQVYPDSGLAPTYQGIWNFSSGLSFLLHLPAHSGSTCHKTLYRIAGLFFPLKSKEKKNGSGND